MIVDCVTNESPHLFKSGNIVKLAFCEPFDSEYFAELRRHFLIAHASNPKELVIDGKRNSSRSRSA